MSLDRRDFLKTTLGAIAVSAMDLDARPAGQPAPHVLDVYYKGQFVHITDKNELYLCCLKDGEGHPPHLAKLYVPVPALDEGAPAGDDSVPGWRGWDLRDRIVLTERDGRPLPPEALAAPSRSRAAATPKVPWPEPVNDAAKWNDRAFVPQLADISPGCTLKANWRDECKSIVGPLRRDALRIHKPCKSADATAVWVWRASSTAVHLSAATDLVSYPLFRWPTVRPLTLNVGDARVPLRVSGPVQIAAICAPELGSPPARKAYGAGYEIAHFHNVYRVVELNAARPARMFYAMQSAEPGTVEGTVCLQPFLVRDDDIFCPGGEPPPGG
jgi:hypothetical protein